MIRRISHNKVVILRYLKIIVLLLSAWLLYRELMVKDRFRENFLAILHGEVPITWSWLIPVLILLFANWALETVKWQVLIRAFARPPFLLSYKAILTGVFVSFFTPNRVGEFAGRVIYLKEKKVEASLLTIAGSLAQNVCTYLFGSLAALFFFAEEPIEWILGGAVLFFLTLTLLFLYFNIDRLVGLIRIIRLPKKWMKYFIPIRRLTRVQLMKALGLSALRYAVFTLQFVLMFQVFAVPISFGMAVQGVGLSFLIHSVLPTIALLEVASRGFAAYYAFQVAPEFDASILLASYSIWLINLFLPGMVGAMLFLFNKNKDVDL
ncbi:MAG: lysylphosphatidylglycerol synthase domain-containing protein [Bacteroidia bacterium]